MKAYLNHEIYPQCRYALSALNVSNGLKPIGNELAFGLSKSNCEELA